MDLVLILQVLFNMIKNNIYIIFFFLFSLSCDKISAPFTEGCLNCCGDSENKNPIKTILIEEFTGHKCSNCPNGTRIIENIIETYCDHVVVLACHPDESLKILLDALILRSSIESTDLLNTSHPNRL